MFIKRVFGKNLFVVLLIGIFVSGCMAYMFSILEDRSIKKHFESMVEDYVFLLERELEINLEVLYSLDSFYKSSNYIDRDEFKHFTTPFIERLDSIVALEWIPRVKDEEREKYEQSARADGFTFFEFTKKIKQGKMVVQDKKDEYYPVYYLEPYYGNELALGYDLGSSEARLKTIQEAYFTRGFVATPPITLIQRGGTKGILIFSPSFNKENPRELDGLFLGVYVIENILKHVEKRFKYFPIHIEISDFETKSKLYNNELEISENSSFTYSKKIDVISKKWYIEAEATDYFIEKEKTYLEYVIFVVGSIITALFVYIEYLLVKEKDTLSKLNDKLQNEVSQKTKELNKYIETIDENVIISKTDLHGRITYVSRAFEEISGYKKAELIGKAHSVVRHPDMSRDTFKEIWKTIQKQNIWRGNIKNLRKDGSFYWVYSVISPDYNKGNTHIGYISIRHDVTDKKKIEQISITDELTSLYNRRYFNESVNRELREADKNSKDLCFSMLDVDNFKLYNDTYGHHKGDIVLKSIADTMIKVISNRGLVFRLGGEEFGVLFYSSSKQEAFYLIEELRISIENLKIEHSKNSASEFVTASFGLLYLSHGASVTSDRLYTLADEGLYDAKKRGRNQVVLKSLD